MTENFQSGLGFDRNGLLEIFVGVGGLLGGVLGYCLSSDAQWSAAVVGAMMFVFMGFNSMALVSPQSFLRHFRHRGHESTARTVPLTAIIVTSLLYFLFRRILGGGTVWAAIVITGVFVGLLALTRLLNVVVYDD